MEIIFSMGCFSSVSDKVVWGQRKMLSTEPASQDTQSDFRIVHVYSVNLRKGGFVAETKGDLTTVFSDQTT